MLGILGGLGPAASCYLYQMLIDHTPATCDQDHLDIVISSRASTPDRTAFILGQSKEDPFAVMEQDGFSLVNYGATVLAIPCNTAHYFLPRLQALTDVPFLSMLEAAAKAARDRFPGGTAAVLATRGTLSSGLYQRALEAAEVPYLIPGEAEQDALMRVIYDGVKADAAPEAYRTDLEAVVASMSRRGAGYFILGCTELPLAAAALGLSVPTLDPTEELAKAAIRWCGFQVKGE